MKFGNGDGSITKVKEKRKKAYRVRVTTGFRIDEKTNKKVAVRKNVGYYATREEALRSLSDYMKNGLCLQYMSFEKVYNQWRNSYFHTLGKSAQYNYEHAFQLCKPPLHDIFISDINVHHLQMVIDSCEQGYPTLKVIKTLFNKVFEYAIIYNYTSTNYALHVDLSKKRKEHYSKIESKEIFSKDEIQLIWDHVENKYDAIILMLIYSGMRIGELLNLKKEDIHLNEKYLEITKSKTEAGIRKVPIADKVLKYYKEWYEFSSENTEYLLYDENYSKLTYGLYAKKYYRPFMKNIGLSLTIHSCRHTCATMLDAAFVDLTIIQNILGHKNNTYYDYPYTIVDVDKLRGAINLI